METGGLSTRLCTVTYSESCEACGEFQPECLVPQGDGAIGLCWLCAHAHVDHGCELDTAAVHECGCAPEAIYPEKLLAARRQRDVARALRGLISVT